jgi:hypothetical protein
MIRVSTIKVVFVVMLLVIIAFLFMKNNISDYYDRPITISSSASYQSGNADVKSQTENSY